MKAPLVEVRGHDQNARPEEGAEEQPLGGIAEALCHGGNRHGREDRDDHRPPVSFPDAAVLVGRPPCRDAVRDHSPYEPGHG